MQARLTRLFAVVCVFVVSACSAVGPGVGQLDQFMVHTPVFADNRVFFIGAEADNIAPLTLQSKALTEEERKSPALVKPNSPLSIVVSSVELPQTWPKNLSTSRQQTIDVAVIVDLATAIDGSFVSYVVWYQRGVVAGQSLNFSNLLVHFEQKWDKRTAPLFRIRVMNVVKERNAETLASLGRVQGYATSIAALISSPIASKVTEIASQAAGLVLAGQKNQNLIDYTVQFYSSEAVAKSNEAGLGALRMGEFVAVGSPPGSSRAFWANEFTMDKRSRVVMGNDGVALDIPLARMVVGTFESIVPKIVIERSNALTQHLAQQSAKTNLNEIDLRGKALQASITAFVEGEKLRRFGVRDPALAVRISKNIIANNYTEENAFYLIRAFNDALKPKKLFVSGDDVKAYLDKYKGRVGQ